MQAPRQLLWLAAGLLGSAAMLQACQSVAENAPDPRIAAGRAMAQQFGGELKSTLESAIAAKGAAAAILVCRDEAPRIAARVSAQHGAAVARTASRVRNPANAPQPWQRTVLASFEQRLSRGEKPEGLESFETDADGSARYMKAIVTAPVCVVCHGGAIAPDVQHALNEYYPNDDATGFRVGDLRGAFSIEWPAAGDGAL